MSARASPWPVAVIGAGCASAAGFEWRGMGRAIAAGERWIAPARALAATHPGVLGAEVPPIPKDRDVGDPKVHRLMSRGARLGAIAARAALAEAELGERRETAGWFYGVGASGSAPDEIEAVLRASVGEDLAWSERRMGERGLKVFHPLRTFVLMPNFTLCHAAILEGVRGPNAALFSRGAGTVTSLVEAAHAIAEGDCEVAIAGGADTSLDCLTWAELVREGHVSAGLLPGEGGGALVIARHAERPLAWITGAVVRPRAGAAPPRGDVASALRAALDEVGRADTAVLTAWGPTADAARAAFDGRIVDLHGALGDGLAAAPALAWCAALDLIHEGHRSVVVISAGPDGHVAIVRLAGARPSSIASVARSVERRAVITGVGAVSAFGVGAAALFDGLAAGARAIRPITCFDASPLSSRIGGQLPIDRVDAAWLEAALPRPRLDVGLRWLSLGALRDRKIAFALAAAAEAWHQAGLETGRGVPLTLACGLERALLEDLAPMLRHDERTGRRAVDWEAEAERASPAVRNRAPIDLAALAVGELLGLGAITTHVSACAAGALAVAHGAALVERGADVVVCGATDAMLDAISVGAMITLGTTSTKNDLDACKPFDLRRDGLVLGEGAAVFVVEDEAHARARGARPIARVLGWGSTQDAYKPSAPDPEGRLASVAMARALARARVSSRELGYINAHGTGTPLNDVAEVLAIRRALGADAERIPVSSIKGAVGHLLAASGAIEIAASLLAFERDLLPGTANHRERDPECALDVIGERSRAARVDCLMSNSFGFGGQNCAVVLGRPA